VSEKIINRGIEHYRTTYDSGDLEKAFADAWEKKNKESYVSSNGEGILQHLYFTHDQNQENEQIKLELGDDLILSNKERIAAATAIQWLGTNCGFAFLRDVLKKCGYAIKELESIKIEQEMKIKELIDQRYKEQTREQLMNKRGKLIVILEA
jgi:hypothetical protein